MSHYGILTSSYVKIFFARYVIKKIINTSTTAVGPLEISKMNAKYSDTGGIIAPTRTETRNTCDIFLPIKIPMVEGRIKYANTKTSPTNLVVREIPIPTKR